MLSKEHRIDKKTFPHIFDDGKRFFASYVTLILLPTPNKKQYAFVVSKKVSKSAVKRNLLRRKYRSVFEEMFTEIQDDYSGIFLIKKTLDEASRDEIKKDLQNLLKKADLI